MVAHEAPCTSAIDLPIDEAAPAIARRAVAETLRAWRVADADVAYDATLVTSELVANAVRHGGTSVELTLQLGADALVIAVADGSSVLPQARDGSLDAESGRGLAILSAITTGWGVEQSGNGKRVWAKLAVRPAS